jgi:glycosyltransferase involved in cell wall biosynthesis
MGTDQLLTPEAWTVLAEQVLSSVPAGPQRRHPHRYEVRPGPSPRVSALASLYEAGPYIAGFMRNMTSQEGFDELCELIIVDAHSPHNEYAVIAPYLNRHANIRYIRCRERIGIYEAWNVALEQARGDYVTNTNVDDLRRSDSFMLQAGVLDALPFVDIVYQDFFYTLQGGLDFDAVAAIGVRSKLPAVTPHTELSGNPPHNAPMWRKRLHDELGPFDARYQSAGDYEFWLRCLAAGKCFFKSNDPHVAYFHNPEGVSTRGGTRGYEEARRATATHWRHLMPSSVVVSRQSFVEHVRRLVPSTPDPEARVDDRYRWLHEAMREAARSCKYPGESARA